MEAIASLIIGAVFFGGGVIAWIVCHFTTSDGKPAPAHLRDCRQAYQSPRISQDTTYSSASCSSAGDCWEDGTRPVRVDAPERYDGRHEVPDQVTEARGNWMRDHAPTQVEMPQSQPREAPIEVETPAWWGRR